jgi:hypothetical protein
MMRTNRYHTSDVIKRTGLFFIQFPTLSKTYSKVCIRQYLSDLTLFKLCLESMELSQAYGMSVDESCSIVRLEVSVPIHGHKILVVESCRRISGQHSN